MAQVLERRVGGGVAGILDGVFGGVPGGRISEAGRLRLEQVARPIAAGPSVYRQEGDACDAITLLDAGLVRVSKRRPSGREVGLYTIGPGELCVLEVLGVLAGTPYRAEAVVERPVTGVAIPAAAFRAVVEAEPGLRAALWKAIEARLARALELVSDAALGSLDARVAALLLREASADGEVRLTHEAVARELGYAREAVSRTLGGWARAGLVDLGRAVVVVRDHDRLAELAALERRQG
ncbi:MAG TPA: Crp/Fnr family transcriptional regulator [Candidatus Limnocylindrales bacterium]|nr:Crp/Fnr family transcriptional regulator [Candidatus Limnocylindrales bacterium]